MTLATRDDLIRSLKSLASFRPPRRPRRPIASFPLCHKNQKERVTPPSGLCWALGLLAHWALCTLAPPCHMRPVVPCGQRFRGAKSPPGDRWPPGQIGQAYGHLWREAGAPSSGWSRPLGLWVATWLIYQNKKSVGAPKRASLGPSLWALCFLCSAAKASCRVLLTEA